MPGQGQAGAQTTNLDMCAASTATAVQHPAQEVPGALSPGPSGHRENMGERPVLRGRGERHRGEAPSNKALEELGLKLGCRPPQSRELVVITIAVLTAAPPTHTTPPHLVVAVWIC